MQFAEVLDAVIKNHPFLDFERKHKNGAVEYWCLCPCGHSTRHFKTKKSAHKDFKSHILEEINEALIENDFLILAHEEHEKQFRHLKKDASRTSLQKA